MPDGEFFAKDSGYKFSEEESGITVDPDTEGSFELDVAFVKAGEPNHVFTDSEFRGLENDPLGAWHYFEIPAAEITAARSYLDRHPQSTAQLQLQEDVAVESNEDLSL